VAIVDAYDWTSAESDMAAYRSKYGLPPCTSASGCFKKIAADGTTNLPPEDGQGANGWGGEIMLDLEMVSAICPACNILLVEAANAGDNAGFAQAPATAKKAGAVAISNSYGSNEDASIATDKSFDLGPGVLITASAGDSGYGSEYPATSPFVVAVGGTNLVKDGSTRGWTEKLWAYSVGRTGAASGTGSGCSQFAPQPARQAGKLPSDINCSMRMESDVSAVADPATGVVVMITNNGALATGVFGGTSASSPIMSALLVRLGVASLGPNLPYDHPTAFFDVASGGTNAPANTNCGRQCKDLAGYDGPTGWGTPNGAALALLLDPAPTPVDGGAGSGGGDAGAPSSGNGGTPSAPGGTNVGSSGNGGGSNSGNGGGNGSGNSAAPAPQSGSGGSSMYGGTSNRRNSDTASSDSAQGMSCAAAPGTAGGAGSAAMGLAFGALALVAARRRRR
jgi:hypothetical protein